MSRDLRIEIPEDVLTQDEKTKVTTLMDFLGELIFGIR
jgi:hypothetical protein